MYRLWRLASTSSKPNWKMSVAGSLRSSQYPTTIWRLLSLQGGLPTNLERLLDHQHRPRVRHSVGRRLQQSTSSCRALAFSPSMPLLEISMVSLLQCRMRV